MALLISPALSLLDITRPFHLYVDEHKGVAKGVLTQDFGTLDSPSSLPLNPVTSGWPPCLWIIAATALLVKDADKLTLGQELLITTPHTIEGVLKQPPDGWMSNARLTHYQGLLLNPPRIRFLPSVALNAATLLHNPDAEVLLHQCQDILVQVHSLRQDLTDQPLPDAEETWFTDSSSFMRDGHRYAGVAVVSETETLWAEPLSSSTSAQWAELIALTKALVMGKGKKINIYTDSRYAFATAHIHGVIYRERGLLMAEGKTVKNKQEILDLLTAIWLPKKVAIIHCPGHQKGNSPVAQGNHQVDKIAKSVALKVTQELALHLPDPGAPVLPEKHKYSPEDLAWLHTIPQAHCPAKYNGWWRTADGRTILSARHRSAPVYAPSHHMGNRKLKDLVHHAKIKIERLDTNLYQIVGACKACQLTNGRSGPAA
ncbi:uncharacterized protein LOC128587564 isoform X1 [Nycticebus coucang]|uniref:uncharacterized protein LOC128587564 isoform X1 n=1 Tax=Nycticebus coucang TaxID=9470 RepID=UPI00234C680A|nr:uncharacterized protein LOC128587564 isoform X1 [Nycticebus coucang]XP_053449810.1 uncharacterized protein LOC128587564 isoform X1 [Nycticebus coucang]XP_053449812.1 uncharacterized protein LOC128587564 isoform X1 [Nycticebus coucang]XP_053449813.1 uncharacterized protein LOC128587564 isoform X1 [Nycticebus coucang]XP_053449814.1 uncharacterized protein LOC128587564 isoform X1 [Nycticebus coucang]XP_053449815.1 uncharacterized protein LOC128587564 isoform X1 [Nycticebus coucang]XP_05344981